MPRVEVGVEVEVAVVGCWDESLVDLANAMDSMGREAVLVVLMMLLPCVIRRR